MEYIHLIKLNEKNDKIGIESYFYNSNKSFFSIIDNYKYLIIIIILTLNFNFSIKIIYSLNNFHPLNNKKPNDILRKFNNYIVICRKGKIINQISYHNKRTKISTIIISYNTEKLISNSIRSVQNQKMSDIEIIIIDDNSSDNSIKLIERIKKYDKRIKLIKNKKNRGALYSRSLGVLNAKSNYLTTLDSDDLFINENIFTICYKEVIINNLDILEFSGFQVKKSILRLNNHLPKIALYLRYKTNNLTLKQPKLFDFLFKKNGTTIKRRVDGYLWGKFIKTNVYIQALNILGKNIYLEYHNYGEDRIVNFVLFKYAKSFKFIKEYGISYLYNPYSICNSYNKEQISHDELINIMSIFNFTKDSINVNIVVYELKYRWKNVIMPGLNDNNKRFVKFMIDLLLKNKYITEKDKKKLKIFIKEIQ